MTPTCTVQPPVPLYALELDGQRLGLFTREQLLAIRETIDASVGSLRFDVMARRVAEAFDLAVADLLGPSRIERFVFPRFVAQFAMRRTTDASLEEISRVFQREHGAILYGINRVEERMSIDAAFRSKVLSILDALAADLSTTTPGDTKAA